MSFNGLRCRCESCRNPSTSPSLMGKAAARWAVYRGSRPWGWTMKIKWADKLGNPKCPYVTRWVFETKWFSIRLHHWKGSDDLRHFHDHEWNYTTFILKGGYIEHHPDGIDILKAGDVRHRPALWKHKVEVPSSCWSLLLTGPKIREFGFWVNGKFRKRNKYFFEHGHH